MRAGEMLPPCNIADGSVVPRRRLFLRPQTKPCTLPSAIPSTGAHIENRQRSLSDNGGRFGEERRRFTKPGVSPSNPGAVPDWGQTGPTTCPGNNPRGTAGMPVRHNRYLGYRPRQGILGTRGCHGGSQIGFQ
ncbi:hypothetical protein DPEC_G00172410 [Dallia pectoralis]|uniref:Uncharacterized protein n=1 Tax=Dallia pectoralis TaxID=75939 RepID=A0ACC2GDC5_DALPE|nr:hypothetical protein DPEC_G00172410 [Dallia pectoralis]